MQPVKRVNYLTNKNFMAAIHDAKNTYCSFEREEYSDFDMIVPSIDAITPETIEAATTARAMKATKAKVPVPDHEIIFRVMCDAHVPLDDPTSKRRRPNPSVPLRVKTPFPPFSHYAIRDGQAVEVGRSHWIGSLSNGYFNADHGKITARLAHMFVLLVTRYSSRGNYRGYSYIDEMRGQALVQLSQVGLQFNEFKSSNPFAFYTQCIKNSFVRVLNMEKRTQNIRDEIMMQNGALPSYTRQIDHEFAMREE